MSDKLPLIFVIGWKIIFCMTKYIDAHCHLQNVGDVSGVLNTANMVGVCGVICNATSPLDWERVIKLMHNHGAVYGCIGVHPWCIQNLPQNWATQMQNILSENPSVMVGEVGIDKHHPNIPAQMEIFAVQLDFAYKFNRPIFIHCVGAWERVLQILKSRHNQLPRVMVAHAFAGSADIISELVEKYNFYFSYSPMIADARRARLISTVRNTPNDRILVESDCDNPALVVDVTRRIAEIKSVAAEKMADIIYNNTIGIL